jgi:hypothetical protein
MTSLPSLKRKRQLREDLVSILDTDSGKRFFQHMLKDCNVSKPIFHRDPNEIVWYEARRHLAMSYLTLVGRDDPQAIIDIIEQEQ